MGFSEESFGQTKLEKKNKKRIQVEVKTSFFFYFLLSHAMNAVAIHNPFIKKVDDCIKQIANRLIKFSDDTL